jgi:23S rRNA pseudouridine1911/1915/1917 synthase
MRVHDEGAVKVLYRDEHFTVVEKPSGLATTSPDGADCLARRVEKLERSSEVVHASSRLDAEVSGLVTFARTRVAIEALSRARAEKKYERLYFALTTTQLEPPEGDWDASIAIDPRDRRKRIATAVGSKEAKQASTHYRTAHVAGRFGLLHLFPGTGRTHQLRVHAAHAGAPLFGDVHYGGERRVSLDDGRVVSAKRVMLHCAKVSLPPMLGGAARVFVCPVPEDLATLWCDVGGSIESVRVPG